MNKYTILFLLPDTYWNGHPSEWIYQAHVRADDVQDAITTGTAMLCEEGHYPDEFAVLAVYEGHLEDLYVNS